MKELKPQFDGIGEVSGYQFLQIRSAEWGFLYEVSLGSRKHYEVFKRRLNRRFATVSYPSSKAFGVWAWTFIDFDLAKDRFEELRTNYNLKKNE